MVFKDSHYIELYKWRLRSETCGSSPEIRQQAAKRELDMRLEEISRRKKFSNNPVENDIEEEIDEVIDLN